MEREINVPVVLWFGVRRGVFPGIRGSSRPSLLIADRSGIYSWTRRQYIRKKRYHRYRALATDLAPVIKAYRSLQKLGMNSWSELDTGARKEVTWWKHTLMDLYWRAAPEALKASAIERYSRARYQRRMGYPFVALATANNLWHIVRQGKFNIWWLLVLLLGACIMLVLIELYVTIRPRLSRSEIHNVLEFELTN